MSDIDDQIIEEFRRNAGKVGGQLAGIPVMLLHHRGRKTGIERVTPMVYLPSADENVMFVMASNWGSPENAGWYYNITSAGEARVESGTETYPVTVRELKDEERARIWATVVRRYPVFGDYEKKTAGIRTIPVVELTRA
ncbi:nitroreductase family deazaflavin-dependent oxidoreductase [Actinoallomurus sp. CA-142502]|uniref:nitroreductase family deazaflavin-dependent oxidoreductase n=1 Tax=Actinoallomurus sp. CA-142502 TaxID=3239885 RepID=UPI003D903972